MKKLTAEGVEARRGLIYFLCIILCPLGFTKDSTASIFFLAQRFTIELAWGNFYLQPMLNNAQRITLKHQHLWLLPQKALYWQKKKTLLIADLHMGKSGHFRKNGIPVPVQINEGNFKILNHLIYQINPKHIIFLGDLFHSGMNAEWQQFREWRQRYSKLQITLVVGNHDILHRKHYHSSHISVFKRLKIDPFLMVHDIETISLSSQNTSLYPLGAHVHPAIKIRGKARQVMKFPCFYFEKRAGILPAFGQFTGTSIIEPQPGDQTFFIIEDHILAV